MLSSSAPSPATLWTSLNQDSTHFAVGLKNGFWIYTMDPLRKRMRDAISWPSRENAMARTEPAVAFELPHLLSR
jgi:hypothetical protein